MAWKRASLAAACWGSLYAGVASSQDAGVDYNLAKTNLPTIRIAAPPPPPKFEATVVEVAKPTPSVEAPASPKPLPAPASPEPPKLFLNESVVATTPETPAPKLVVDAPKVVAPSAALSAAPAPMAMTPAPIAVQKSAARTTPPAPINVGVARASSPAPMYASYAAKQRPTYPSLPTGDAVIPYDPRICAECVRILGASPIDADREKALATLGRVVDWQHYRPAYQALRRVALTEYSTKMRLTAVKLLAEAKSDHALVADTLKTSAQYDSEATIRSAAVATLEKLASASPSRYVR